MFMEESVKRTALSMMSLAVDAPLHLPETVITDEERRLSFDKTMGTDRLYFFQHFGSSSIENIVNRVKYMAKGLGCKYVALDHLSIIVSSQENGDERKAIDAVMTALRTLVQETNICLFVISHLRRPTGTGHEDGASTSLSQLRGSGAIAQLSDIVIGAERNGQADDPRERNTTQLRVLKNRWSGDTGPACKLIYNKESGRMYETFDDPNEDVL
jgi:twinkle protein